MLPKITYRKLIPRPRWLVPLLPIALTGCAGVLSPASIQGERVSTLFWTVFAIAAAIFVVTEALLVIALIRFRSRRGAGEPHQVHGNIRLETAWTVAPALIVLGVFVATVATMAEITQQQPNEIPVKVVGHQWWWEIQYPGQAITTATDLHVPVGQAIAIELTTADVIHSFWVPEIIGKVDQLPGHVTSLRFNVGKPGTYRGQCAEYCGTQHANMGVQIIAQPATEFEEWVRQNQARPVIPTAGQAARGAQAFMSGTCVGCHTIEGTPAQGKLGPDLSHFGSRRSIGALTLDNTEANLANWLKDPQAVKPGNKMRIPKLSQETIDDLVVFLQSLK